MVTSESFRNPVQYGRAAAAIGTTPAPGVFKISTGSGRQLFPAPPQPVERQTESDITTLLLQVMTLPLDMNTPPMEARPVADLPSGDTWRYEPKWNGFRCLAYRDGEHVALRSKSGQDLGRYFPDVVAALGHLAARQFVLDGEIVIPIERRLSFEALQLRLHPAESRVRKLAAERPALYVVFDLLVAADG